MMRPTTSPDCGEDGQSWISSGCNLWVRRHLRCKCAIIMKIPGRESGFFPVYAPDVPARLLPDGKPLLVDLSTPRSIISLWIKRSVANGIRASGYAIPGECGSGSGTLHKWPKPRGGGGHCAGCTTASPVHTQDHWAQKFRKFVTKECVDRIMIEDASGILTPELSAN